MKTRTIRYRDGRHEVIQVLDEGRMATWSSNDPLAYEASIMWLTDFRRLPFVRVLLIRTCDSRSGRLVPRGGGKVVGYAKLTEDAPVDPGTGRFSRRVFYLREEDLEQKDNASISDGAINPKTILPGCAGDPLKTNELTAKPRLKIAKRPSKTTRRAQQDDDVMEWLADAIAPALSVRPTPGAPQPDSQSQIDTEIAHDVPETRRSKGRAANGVGLKRAGMDAGGIERGGRYGFLLSATGKSFPLDKDLFRIGRDRECDLVIRESNVSGLHCELMREKNLWFVEDQGSTNGTRINGVRLAPSEKVPLDPNVKLTIGKHEFTVRYDIT